MKKKIKVYGVPTCPFCKRARKFFKDKGFDFEDLDVSVNHDLAKEMIKKSGQMSIPVIEVDGEIIIGFNKEKIETLLGS